MLNSSAQIPLYIQIKDLLKQEIQKGNYKFGDKIPTEPELGERFNVSRVTIRKAIEDLVGEGYLVKRQGKGTFVNQKKMYRKLKYVMGFTESCIQNDLKPSTKILSIKECRADKDIANRMDVEVGTELLYTKRIRYASGMPLLFENNYFVKQKYDFLLKEDMNGSLYSILAKYNIFPGTHGEATIELFLADVKLSKLMEVPIGTPFFYMDTIILDQNNEVIHLGHQYYLAEYYKFNI